MEQRKSKIEYEKPKLIVLKGNVGLTEGLCPSGSGDSGICGPGNSAGTNCGAGANPGTNCAVGTGFAGCNPGLIDATCTPSGSGPPM